jgi:transcriptional regulator with XRE-family HTH domain
VHLVRTDDEYVIKEMPMSMSGRMVREARRRAGLTQRQLSAKAGIPQETIARIERGRVDPRVHTLDRLLEGCGHGLESMPRLGIGVDRTQIRALLRLSPSERLEVAIANDQHFVELRRSIRRVVE